LDRKITIVGCGPGAQDLLTLRAKTAIEGAECVVGSRRLIEDLTVSGQRTITVDGNYKAALKEARHVAEDGLRVAFLVSGDPLFCSFGTLVLKEFGEEACEVVSGIGSIQYAFTLLKEGWKDYRLLSLHGCNDVAIEEVFTQHDKFAILLDPDHNLGWIKSKLNKIGIDDRVFYVGTNLSLSNEEFKEVKFKDFGDTREESLAILIVKKRDNND
jgi:precorrin-6y C5,15-methyltransferase (decarboxylating) CbiE subunit